MSAHYFEPSSPHKKFKKKKRNSEDQSSLTHQNSPKSRHTSNSDIDSSCSPLMNSSLSVAFSPAAQPAPDVGSLTMSAPPVSSHLNSSHSIEKPVDLTPMKGTLPGPIGTLRQRRLHQRSKSGPAPISRSSNEKKFPNSFDLLKAELLEPFASDEKLDQAPTHIRNFFFQLFDLEHYLFFGYLLCLDIFLSLFTFLPLRSVIAIFSLIFKFSLSPSQRWDLIRFFILFTGALVLFYFDTSRVYHWIRQQNVIKLYVVFNVLEVLDRLACAFGSDLFDSLFHHSHSRRFEIIDFFRVIGAIIYTVIHSSLLLSQCIALNVAINSTNLLLFSLLISNQFVEVKSNVFKKCTEINLFSILCSDICERFQMVLFLGVVAVHNFSALGWELDQTEISKIVQATWIVLLSEVIVDHLKHAFITRFNGLHYSLYFSSFRPKLCDSICSSTNWTDVQPLARVLGFVPIPLGCLVLRTIYSVLPHFGLYHWIFSFLCFLVVCLVKIKLRAYLIIEAEQARSSNKKVE